jgi:hypothetical protein
MIDNNAHEFLGYIYKMRGDAEVRLRLITEKIALSYNNKEEVGLTQTQICKMTDLGDDTVRKYCNLLIKQGVLVRKGKIGKYIFTDGINPNLFGFRSRNNGFRYRTLSKIFKWKVNHKNPNKFTYLSNDKKLFNEEVLYEFSNKIAAYILFVFIEGLSPEKWIPDIKGSNLKHSNLKYLKKELVTKGDKETFTRNWIEDTINPELIFKQFCKIEFVKEGLLLKDNNKKLRRREGYEMNPVNHSALVDAFRNVFPEIFVELENKKYENLKSKSAKDYYQPPEPVLTKDEEEKVVAGIYQETERVLQDYFDRRTNNKIKFDVTN